MKTRESRATDLRRRSVPDRWRHEPFPPVSALRLVTRHEMESLQQALTRGSLPPDFAAKLNRLGEEQLLHRSVERQSRLFLALLQAARDGRFHAATNAELERLLRVLAYVRKEDDAIPDYRTNGFTDDQQVMRAVMTQLLPLIRSFKAWRLRHQVPEMWLHN